MQQDEPGLFDMPAPEPRSRRNPRRGRNRETWMRTVTVEITVIDTTAIERAAADAERNAIDLSPRSVSDDIGSAPEDVPADPLDLIASMVWATDGQHDLVEVGAFRILEITSDVVDGSSNGGVIAWSSTVKLADAERLRELAARNHPADVALIEEDLTAAWNHAADPYAPIRSMPGIEWQPLTVDVEHLPARAGRGRVPER